MAATRSHFQTLPLLVILYCVLSCDCGSRGSYSLSSGTPSQSRKRGNTPQQPEVADERGRGRLLYSSVLEQSTIPDYTVRTRLTAINSASTTYLRNFEFSDVQVGDSARFTPIDDVTAELVTSDLSWIINADFEIAVTSFWLSWDDEGTISYRVEASTLNIVYDRHGGPNGEFRQRSCVGDLVLSTPSVTAYSGDSGLYTIVLNDIEDDIRRDVTIEICKLFDPAENRVTALQLDSFKEVFQRTCPPIPHAIFTDCPFTLNSACAVSCEEDYTTAPSLTPDATIVCTRRGEWNIPEESVCVVASCDNSPDACTEEGETCIDKTPSGFRCQCEDGYIRNSDDTACIAESCDNSPDACTKEGETCIDKTPSGFRCQCDYGYIRNSDDTSCIVFDDVFDDRPSDGTVFDGENYHLTCSSRILTLELSWFKDGSALVYSERIFKLGDDLLLRDVTSDDSGLYVCVASDEEGAVIAEASSRVDVLSHNLNDDECGIITSSEAVNVENRRDVQSGWIVGGRDAKRGSAPWMARLFVNGQLGRSHMCGGSLVDRQWVVTAAHCLNDLRPEDLSIRLGDHDTLTDDPPEISVRVEAFYEHEDFDEETFENDIALIKLARPLTSYSDYIRPICLANRTIDKELLLRGTRGRVNGWGATFEGGVESVYLQEVFLPYVKYKECKKAFRSMGYRFTRSMFCAGFERGGADSCQGDSGGPYSNKRDDRWYLTGIVSLGVGCARPGSNGVYTRYSKYHTWLQDIVNDS